MWKIFILSVGILCQLVCRSWACQDVANTHPMTQLKFFIATVVGNRSQLHVQSYMNVLNDMEDEFNVGVTFGTTFKTALPVDLTLDRNSTTCLRLAYGRVRQLNQLEDQDLIGKYPETRNFPPYASLLMSFKQLELDVSFDSEQVVGLAKYNDGCIGRRFLSQTRAVNADIDVSECLFEVSVLEALEAPGDYYSGIKKNSPKDALSLMLVYTANFWLKKYSGRLINVTASLPDLIKSFPKTATRGLTKKRFRDVETLRFPSSSFIEIKNDDLPALPHLKTLDFSGGSLKHIESKAFQSLINLKHLNLAGNQLQELPQALTPLINLETLTLRSNQFGSGKFNYAPNILGQLSRLRILDLSHTPLASAANVELRFNSSNKTMLNFLQVLDVSSASLDDFPESFIGMFPNLEVLVSSNNLLTSTKSLKENTWDRLRTLELNSNNLDDDVDYASLFITFPQLQTLNLANNRIGMLSRVEFGGVVNHQRLLNVSGNAIRQWNEPILAERSRLDIDMTRNNIAEVTPAMLTDFSQLNHVHLTGNPFDCHSCELDKFQQWLKESFNSTDHGKAPYRCVFPKQSAGLFVADIVFDPYLCVFNWLLNFVIPLVVVVVVGGAIGFLVFRYRWHIRYLWYVWQAKWNTFRNGKVDVESVPEYRYDAFVSYSGADSGWVVDHLIPMLEEEEPRLHLCVHERDFLIGEAVINNVIRCIDISRKSIFLITNSFVRSQWCQWELQMAQHKLFEDKKDVLVLIVLEELVKSDIPRELQRLMATTTYHVWPSSATDKNAPAFRLFWARLRQCIGPCHCLQKQLEDRGIFFR